MLYRHLRGCQRCTECGQDQAYPPSLPPLGHFKIQLLCCASVPCFLRSSLLRDRQFFVIMGLTRKPNVEKHKNNDQPNVLSLSLVYQGRSNNMWRQASSCLLSRLLPQLLFWTNEMVTSRVWAIKYHKLFLLLGPHDFACPFLISLFCFNLRSSRSVIVDKKSGLSCWFKLIWINNRGCSSC